MMQNTELRATVNVLQRLLDTHQAREVAMLAASMAEAMAIQELTKSAHSAWQAAQQKDPNTYIPIAPFITPLLAVLGVQQPTPLSDEAPKTRMVSIPDNAGLLIGDVPTLDTGEDAELVEPVKRTRKRKPTLAGVARQAAKAGIEVAAYEVRSDGIKVTPGKPREATMSDDNDTTSIDKSEWD